MTFNAQRIEIFACPGQQIPEALLYAIADAIRSGNIQALAHREGTMTNQAPPEIHQRIDNDFGYHKATPETGPMHDEVRSHFKALAQWAADWVPAGREQSLMLTALQEAQMWANAAIAVNLSPLDGASA